MCINFSFILVQAITSAMFPGLVQVIGPPGTGKTDVAVQMVANLYLNFPKQKTLIVTRSNQALNQIFAKITGLNVDPGHLLRMGHSEEDSEMGDWGKGGRVEALLKTCQKLLLEVDRLATSLGATGAHGSSCETAGYFYLTHVAPLWESYRQGLKQYIDQGKLTKDTVVTYFPFAAFFTNVETPLFENVDDAEACLEVVEGCYRHIKKIFDRSAELRAFEVLRSPREKGNYLMLKEARIIAMTSTHAAVRRHELAQLGFKYDNVVIEEAAQLLEIETFIPIVMQKTQDDGTSRLKRVILIGDHNQLPPVVTNRLFKYFSNMEQSLFMRFIRSGVPTIQLDKQGRCRPDIADLFRPYYQNLGDLPAVIQGDEYRLANPGFAFDYQLIDVPDYMGQGEVTPVPNFYQNLGEAEYVVAVYSYMRMIGYPADKISILTTYNGQRELIRDIVQQRCAKNPLLGWPAIITTVDRYQGEQNDCACSLNPILLDMTASLIASLNLDVLLSLVRTNSVGYLRELRRLVVTVSRSRLGLYVFARKSIFVEHCELREVFSKFGNKPDRLWLKTGEEYGDIERVVEETGVSLMQNATSSSSLTKAKKRGGKGPKSASIPNVEDGDGRWTGDDASLVEVDGVEEMGKLTHEMLLQRIAELKKERTASAMIVQ